MIGINIKNARIKKGWSQKQLSDNYNLLIENFNKSNHTNFRTIGRTTITHWETDRYNPDIDAIPFLCELLQISADDLLDIEKILENEEKNTFQKNFSLENGMNVSITTPKPWEQLSEEQQKEIMDSVIEESVKIKKESSKKDS